MRIIFSDFPYFQSINTFELRGTVNLKLIRDYLQKLYPTALLCYCNLKLFRRKYEELKEYNDNPERMIYSLYGNNEIYVVYMKNNKCYCNYTKYQLINIIQNSQNEGNIYYKEYEAQIKELKVKIDYLEKKEKNNERTIEQLKKNNEKLSTENKKLEDKPEWKKLYELKEENQKLMYNHSKEMEKIKKEFENKFENLKSENKELEKKGENNEKQYQKKMEQINQTNNQLIGKIKNDYEKEIKKLNSMNEKKLNEFEQKHNEEIKSIKKNNQIELNKLNIETERLKEEKQKDKKNYEENINNLKKTQIEEQQKLENKYNEKILQINEENLKLKNEGEILANVDPGNLRILSKYGLIKNISSNSNALEIDSENRIKINSQMPTKVVFEEFYDLIVNIKSVKDIDKGWELKMNQKGKENYNKFKTEPVIKIGVIGNSNKGKSFILSKLSKINLPSGASIRTEGLSIKYPEIKDNPNRKIVLLDSAGLETPVLYEEIKKEFDNDISKNSISESTTNEEELNEKNNHSEINENDNYNVINNNKKIDPNDIREQLFKEKSREKIMTELFLQNYIMHNSDILILVVGILTYSEQKLINRIKTEMKNQKIDKPLYIIHNLVLYETKEKVENHIENVLLKCATFKLEKSEKININQTNIDGVHYYEKNSKPIIYHLILANDLSDAGEYYNPYTIKFIENTFSFLTDLKPFDIINSLKDRFVNISKDYFETPILKNEFMKNEDMLEKKIMKLNKDENQINNIQLKSCLIDELGFSNFKGNGFIPKYNYFEKGDNICVRIEVPGNYTLNCGNLKYRGEYTIIPIQGEKITDKIPSKVEENLYTTREFGKFEVNIYLQTEKYKIKDEKVDPVTKNGVAVFNFPLLKEEIKNVSTSFNEL